MGTLKTMTEEYFGKTLREEDYIKYSIDNNKVEKLDIPASDFVSDNKGNLYGQRP